MTHVEKTLFENLIFKYVYFDTMMDVTVKKREQRIGILYFQYWEQGSVQNPKIYWKENSRVKIGRMSHCLLPQKLLNLEIWRYSCNPKTISEFSNQEWWITQRFLIWVQFISTVDWVRNNFSIAEAGLEIVRVCTQSYKRKTNISSTMVSVQFVSTTIAAKQK